MCYLIMSKDFVSGLLCYCITPLYLIVLMNITTSAQLRQQPCLWRPRPCNIKVSEEEIKEALSKIETLQAYPDVQKGLKLLKDQGFRLATLTNSPPNALKQQLINSNLTDYFEQALSIDSLKKYKPEAATYLWAAKKLQVKPEEMMLVAAHGWDIAGASAAGLQTCFIAREGQSLYSLSNNPDFQATDILTMAEKLVTAYCE